LTAPYRWHARSTRCHTRLSSATNTAE